MKNWIRTCGLPAVLLAIPILATPVRAQSTTGSLQGTVMDEQHAVVPGATVTVRNVDTNARRTTVSRFRRALAHRPTCPSATTRSRSSWPGFATVVRSGLTLALNQDAVVDVQPEDGHRAGDGHRAPPTPRS